MSIEDDITPRTIRWLSQNLEKFWWVILFAISCLFIYEQGQKAVRREYQELSIKYEQLKQEKTRALWLREDMQRQINSQSDFEWIELTLMKGLGLVPEGQKKVYFTND